MTKCRLACEHRQPDRHDRSDRSSCRLSIPAGASTDKETDTVTSCPQKTPVDPLKAARLRLEHAKSRIAHAESTGVYDTGYYQIEVDAWKQEVDRLEKENNETT